MQLRDIDKKSLVILNSETSNILKGILKETKQTADELILNLVENYDVNNFQEIETFAIGDAIGYGIYVIDQNKTIVKANKFYQELTGMWEREYIGKNVNYVLDNYFVNSRAVAVESLKSGKKTEGLGRPRRTDKDLLVTAIPILDNNNQATSVITVLRDATEQVQLQNKLDKNLQKTEVYEHELNYYRSKEKQVQLFIGNSENMEKIKSLITQVAPVDTTILITGETGVGKEVVSREIHIRSSRKNYPYIKVNCAAIPASLMESELFGYEKGAFTGADNMRKLGFFEMANKGTILLDEIGEIPLPLQSKMLRVLQEKELTRLGGTKPIPVDIRIIAATNKDLMQEVKDGLFRRDLYYRLCVIPMEIPPLRERISDIHILADHFADKFNRRYASTKKISLEAIKVLERYDWPGNVRELENIIERLVVISKSDIIDAQMVSSVVCIGGEAENQVILNNSETSLKDAVMSLEKQLIERALNDTGSSYKAAEKLGIDQSTIVRKAKKMGIKNWKV
jgi:PAS domain S-box-containing protein